MAHEILSVKLAELDDSLDRLHSRILMSQSENHEPLRREILQLELECVQAESTLRNSLRCSKSELTSLLEESYGQVEGILRRAKAKMHALAEESKDGEAAVEEQILLAEYVLDFAHRAADRALLVSMEAIDAQLTRQKEGEAS